MVNLHALCVFQNNEKKKTVQFIEKFMSYARVVGVSQLICVQFDREQCHFYDYLSPPKHMFTGKMLLYTLWQLQRLSHSINSIVFMTRSLGTIFVFCLVRERDIPALIVYIFRPAFYIIQIIKIVTWQTRAWHSNTLRIVALLVLFLFWMA